MTAMSSISSRALGGISPARTPVLAMGDERYFPMTL